MFRKYPKYLGDTTSSAGSEDEKEQVISMRATIDSPKLSHLTKSRPKIPSQRPISQPIRPKITTLNCEFSVNFQWILADLRKIKSQKLLLYLPDQLRIDPKEDSERKEELCLEKC